jgi:5-methylcytosine-specific restriction endonuclease McrA
MTTTDVLLLNADYSPIKVISWKQAIGMLLDDKVYMVEDYANRVIRSATMEMKWPAVIALKRYVKRATRVKFNRANVMARDGYTCQYCGVRPKTTSGRPDLRELTLEHVVPRSRSVARKGGRQVFLPWDKKWVPVTCWENVVAACGPCNLDKAARTPSEAGMKLRKLPHTPNPVDIVRMSFLRMTVPVEWEGYLPDARSTEYWNVELDSD